MPPKRLQYIRPDLRLIAELIDDDSRVLDLGCGTGDLLAQLVEEKNVQGHGIEIDVDNITECIEKGVQVVHGDIDHGLGDYPDQSFDFVVLSQTLQAARRPHIILQDMLRVGKTGIVSLINFAYFSVRWQLFIGGYMPKTKTLPYEWYDTPNIHLTTIRDFKDMVERFDLKIVKQINLGRSRRSGLLTNLAPNCFSDLSIFVIQHQ